MKLENLDASEVYAAISDGVYRAIWQMITNSTDMPCNDFYDTIKDAAKAAFSGMQLDANN